MSKEKEVQKNINRRANNTVRREIRENIGGRWNY